MASNAGIFAGVVLAEAVMILTGIQPEPTARCPANGRFRPERSFFCADWNGVCWSGAVGAGFRIVVGNGLAAYGKAWAIAAAPKTMMKRETSAATSTGWRLHKLYCDMIRA